MSESINSSITNAEFFGENSALVLTDKIGKCHVVFLTMLFNKVLLL